MGPHDLINRLHDEPFKPFRIRLSNATSIDVVEPGMVIVGPTSAVLPTEFVEDQHGNRLVLRWKTVALGHMVEVSDIDPNLMAGAAGNADAGRAGSRRSW